jgi:ribosomal protein S18 acetylase RimI-like enzyme
VTPRTAQPPTAAPPSAVEIKQVSGPSDLQTFLRFPWQIYDRDSPWVPPLLSDVEELVNPERGHPFHAHAEIALFLAFREGSAVGRVAAIRNQAHLDVYDDAVGFFGFFESVDDDAVACALLDAAGEWLLDRGLTTMRGPMSPSINDQIGILLDDFAGRPVIEMAYNPPYYPDLLEHCGMQLVRRLYAYLVRADEHRPTEKQARLGETVKNRYGVEIRNARVKDAEKEAAILERIYREAWSELWGAVPFTPEEALYLTKKLASLADERVVLIADVAGEPAGFALSVPDWNYVLAHLNGRLTPFNALKALWYKRKMKGLRLMALGVVAEHRRKGIEALMTLELFQRGVAAGYEYLEVSWVLEDNVQANNVLRNLGFPRYRTYGLYEKSLSR